MTEELVERSSRCKLFHILKRFQGEDDVVLRTVGGFQFELGRLVRVDDGMAIGTDVDVFLPGGGEIDLGNITINLCAVFSVGIEGD